jgi:hypothetical protein
MSIDLHKKAEKVGINLKKKGISNPPMLRVGAAWDISGSARNMYYDGEMQEAMNHVLGIAMAFDPTHKLDNFVFDDGHAQLDVPATPENYTTYIQDQVLNETKIKKWGSTKYAGVVHQMQDHYFGQHHSLFGFFHKKKPKSEHIPALCFLFTDGANDDDDHEPAARAFERASDYPVFFCLVGIGNGGGFPFLRRLERTESDCEFVKLTDIRISDDDLYEKIVSPKLVNWLRTHPTS